MLTAARKTVAVNMRIGQGITGSKVVAKVIPAVRNKTVRIALERTSVFLDMTPP
jgi:hypothetical protein